MEKQTNEKTQKGFFNKVNKALTSLSMQKAVLAVAIIFVLSFAVAAGNVIIKNGQISAAENVSIGAATPQNKLHVVYGGQNAQTNWYVNSPAIVESNTAGYLNIRTPNTTYGGVIFSDPDAQWSGAVHYNHNTNMMILGTNGVDNRMVITSTGSVGIGTTAPGDYYSAADNLVIAETAGNAGLTIAANNASGYSIIYFADGTSGTAEYIGGIEYSHGTDLLKIWSGGNVNQLALKDGNTGINDTTPSVALDVGGTVRADNFTEYSPMFVGDAVSAIKNIKPESSAVGNWANVDHSTLPEGVRVQIKEQVWRNKQTGEILDRTDPPKGSEGNYELIERTVEGRNLGNSVQLNTRAIQQLIEQNEQLQARVAALEAK